MIQKQLNKINQIGVYEEGRETKYIKNEDLIQRDTTDNEAKNLDTYKEVIDEHPYNKSPDMMEYFVNKNMCDTKQINRMR